MHAWEEEVAGWMGVVQGMMRSRYQADSREEWGCYRADSRWGERQQWPVTVAGRRVAAELYRERRLAS